MRSVRKSHLDFTPLLDIVLLLLFVFLMMIAEGLEDKESLIDNEKEKYTNLEATTGLQIDELNENIQGYKKFIEEKEDEVGELKGKIDSYEDAYNELVEAISSFVESDEEAIAKIVEESSESTSSSKELIEELIDVETVAESILKYEALQSQFYFIHIEMKGSNNRLYINDKSTSKGISLEEVSDTVQREEKIKEIKGLIEEEMANRQGGSAMTFVILKVSDSSVYQYAWNVVWEAMGELQEKYGTDSLFRTHITMIE